MWTGGKSELNGTSSTAYLTRLISAVIIKLSEMSFMLPGPSGLLNKVTLSCLQSVHAVAPLTLWGWLPCWCDNRQSQAGISPSNPRTSMIQLRPWYHVLPSANKTPVLLGESTALNTEAWIRALVFMTYSMMSILCEEGSPPTSFILDLFCFFYPTKYLFNILLEAMQEAKQQVYRVRHITGRVRLLVCMN